MNTQSNMQFINLGVALTLLNKGDIVTMLHDNKIKLDIKQDVWCDNTVALVLEDKVIITNSSSKLVVMNDKLSIDWFDDDNDTYTGIIASLNLALELSAVSYIRNVEATVEEVVEAPKAPKVTKATISNPEEVVMRIMGGSKHRTHLFHTLTPVLPQRVGRGYKKTLESTAIILDKYLIHKDDFRAIRYGNKDIKDALRQFPDYQFNQSSTDVVIYINFDGDVVVEAETFSVTLKADSNSRYCRPYVYFSMIDKNDVDDLKEVAMCLHAIDALVVEAARRSRA